MKIAFVTSGLEPERNGVGDYTVALADECRARGHAGVCLALNDTLTGALPASPDLLRLGRSQSWPDRVVTARQTLAAFDPDWVSLQFVCYGFHPRGFCWAAATRLRDIIGERPVHLMLHELWIGAEGTASWKPRVFGSMQRAGVLRLYRKLRIEVTHTSNPAYAAMLRARRIPAAVLPLFGAVPLCPPGDTTIRSRGWRFLMFGTLHPVWPPEPLLALLASLGAGVEIWHAGQIGSGVDLWENMTRAYAGRITFKRWGAQSPEQLAKIFSEVDFGIATTPWEIVGKSASVAAMLEHGLPVVVNRDDVHIPGWTGAGYDLQLIKMTPELPRQLRAARRRPAAARLPEITSSFLDELQAKTPQITPRTRQSAKTEGNR